jgi:hypothetical protein
MNFGYTSLLAAFLLFDTFGCGDCVTADFLGFEPLGF